MRLFIGVVGGCVGCDRGRKLWLLRRFILLRCARGSWVGGQGIWLDLEVLEYSYVGNINSLVHSSSHF